MSDVRLSFLWTQKFSTFEDLVQFLCLHGLTDFCARFGMVAWSVWERRNRVHLKHKIWRVEEVVQHASKLLRELWEGTWVVEHNEDL